MTRNTGVSALILAALSLIAIVGAAQTQSRREALAVQGYPGEINVSAVGGHLYVDVQDLARLTSGSVAYEKGRVVLTLPGCDGCKSGGENATEGGFSRPFMKAGIEAMASIREWGGILMITVQNGYPVGNTMAGNAIEAYHGRAADNVALASAAASTDADYRGLELLKNEFNSVQDWANKYAEARRSLNAANLTVSENALKDDPEVQKMIHCGQFLAQMYAGGTIQENTACR